MLHDDGHPKKILPDDSTQTPRIRQNQNEGHTGGNIVEYKLRDLATAYGNVYIEAKSGMYRLPQS